MPKKFRNILIIIAGIVVILGATHIYQNNSGQVLGNFVATVSSSTPIAADLKIDFFSVGQGDSELIVTPGGEDILVDGGPDKTVIQKLGQYLPFDDRTIEYVILSHPHSDHVNGLAEVLKRYTVKEVIMTGAVHTAPDYLEFLSLIKEKNIPTLIIEQPQDLVIDGIRLQFLEPTKSYQGLQPPDMNNSSIVFKLDYVSTTALFMGDFENEESLVVSSSAVLKTDLLKVGHHGSTNANSKDFLVKADPQYAVIEVGQGNSYGLPNYRTIYYLQQLGAQVFRTDQDGDVKFESDGKNWEKIK